MNPSKTNASSTRLPENLQHFDVSGGGISDTLVRLERRLETEGRRGLTDEQFDLMGEFHFTDEEINALFAKARKRVSRDME